MRDEHGIPQIYADSTARPDARAGLRARPGAVLRDGRAPARDRRPAGRAVRRGRPRDRRVRAHDGLAAGRRAGAAAARPGHPRRARRLRRRASTPTWRTARRRRSRSSTPCSTLGGLDYPPERRGRRSTRSPGSRRWRGTCAATWRTRSTGRSPPTRSATSGPPSCSRRTPTTQHPPIVDQGAVVDGVFEQDAATGGTRNPRPARRSAATALAALAGVARRPRPDARAARQRRRHRQQLAGSSTASTPPPARRSSPTTRTSASRCPASGCRSGLHCREVATPARTTSRASRFSGVPGVIIGHNADIAWGFTNLGPDVTDLYVERVDGDDLALRRQRPSRCGPARRRSRSPAATTSSSRCGRPTTARSSPTSTTTLDGRSRSRRELPRPDARAEEYAVALAWTALEPRPTADAHPRAQPRRRLGRLPGGARATSRRRRRTSSTPTARATSATRRPAGSRSASPGNDGLVPAAGWRPENDWTGEYVPVRRAAQRARPRRGLHRHRQPGRRPTSDYPYFLTDDWDRGYRSQRIRDLLEDDDELSMRRRCSTCSSTTATRWRRCWCRTCSTSTCRAATTRTASGCSATGTSGRTPTAPPRPTTTSCGATCSR